MYKQPEQEGNGHLWGYFMHGNGNDPDVYITS